MDSQNPQKFTHQKCRISLKISARLGINSGRLYKILVQPKELDQKNVAADYKSALSICKQKWATGNNRLCLSCNVTHYVQQ